LALLHCRTEVCALARKLVCHTHPLDCCDVCELVTYFTKLASDAHFTEMCLCCVCFCKYYIRVTVVALKTCSIRMV